MNNNFFKRIMSATIWIDLCAMFFVSSIAILLRIPWYLTVAFTFISAVNATILFFKKKQNTKSVKLLEKHMRIAVKKAKREDNALFVYDILENELLPAVRNNLPHKIYKYYQLEDDIKSNSQRFDALRNNRIWASVCSEFNDPFEGQYLYINEDDFQSIKISNPETAIRLWNSFVQQINRMIAIICFTQSPNNMPMWAHYANEHKGYCVEYEVDKCSNLYPVFYLDNRAKAQTLFVEFIYNFFRKEAEKKDRIKLLKHIMFLNAFKDKSWESEREIRAIFMNSSDGISNKGKLVNCEMVGIHPTKVFIGANCHVQHEKELIEIAHELNIKYEKCRLYSNKGFQIVSELDNHQ